MRTSKQKEGCALLEARALFLQSKLSERIEGT